MNGLSIFWPPVRSMKRKKMGKKNRSLIAQVEKISNRLLVGLFRLSVYDEPLTSKL